NGVVLVVFTSGGETRDLAARAGRAALALAHEARDKELQVSLATGWARLDGLLPVGEVIDRAARLPRALPQERGPARTGRAAGARAHGSRDGRAAPGALRRRRRRRRRVAARRGRAARGSAHAARPREPVRRPRAGARAARRDVQGVRVGAALARGRRARGAGL